MHRIDTMATIGYYISKLSKTCVFIIGCMYMKNMSNQEIVKWLNKRQNTKRFYPKLVDEIYFSNLRALEKKLDKAGMIRREKDCGN